MTDDDADDGGESSMMMMIIALVWVSLIGDDSFERITQLESMLSWSLVYRAD